LLGIIPRSLSVAICGTAGAAGTGTGAGAGAGCACPGCAIINWAIGCVITCCIRNGTGCTGSMTSSGCANGGGGGTFNPASTASSIK